MPVLYYFGPASPVVGVLLPADCLVGVGVQVAGLVHHLAQARLHHNHLPGLNILPTNNESGLVDKISPLASIINLPPLIVRVDALLWIEFSFDRGAYGFLVMGGH